MYKSTESLGLGKRFKIVEPNRKTDEMVYMTFCWCQQKGELGGLGSPRQLYPTVIPRVLPETSVFSVYRVD